MEENIKVYGLSELSNKVPELLYKDVQFRNEPDKWKWKPSKPEKIMHVQDEVNAEKEAVNFTAITNYTPSDKRQKLVLVFYMGNLSYGFIQHLESRRVKYFYLNFHHFVAKGSIQVAIAGDKRTNLLEVDGLRLDLDDVSAVLWNLPNFPYAVFEYNMIPQKGNRNEFLFRKRWALLLRELKGLLHDDVAWLPADPYSGTQEWQNKISEYKLAQELGLQVPPFIFTNDHEALCRFVETHHLNECLLREFSTPPFSFPPIRIKAKDVDKALLKNAPCLFQQYIDKKYEYRVVLLFDQVFACRIYSQDSELSKQDWRVHDDANVKWELTALPAGVSEKLVQLKQRLGLNWCSIDMIQTPDDEYYFLEANRPGSHYWLDMFVDLDITREIVEAIVSRGLAEQLES